MRKAPKRVIRSGGDERGAVVKARTWRTPGSMSGPVGTLTMLFVGFTSAYVVRRAAADWGPLAPPRILWANGAVLIGIAI